MNLKKYLCECLGTFVLVLTACGVAMFTGGNIVPTALAFGLVIVAMAYVIGPVSGCHINPAVSLAMLISKKMTVKDFIGYIISQTIGALAGAAILLIFNKAFLANVSLGSNFVNISGDVLGTTGLGIAAGLLAEIILTFVFVFAILGVTSKKSNSAVSGIVIGLALTLVHLLGISVTGTSVNPARSVGPAIIQAIAGGSTVPLQQIWIFILAPLAGAALAAVVFGLINNNSTEEE